MPPASKVLGILKPVGGGDPVPLTKETLRVGRRPSCDICLDFERISGKHCELRFFHGLWHIRDIGSTNGTTVNGLKYATEQSVLPDVEIGIGGHLYTIEYEPAGPSSVVEGAQILDDDVIETRTRKSLMELAGLEVEGPRKSYRPSKPPEQIERTSVDEVEFDQAIPDDLPMARPLPMVEASDDDFFNMIADDLGPQVEVIGDILHDFVSRINKATGPKVVAYVAGGGTEVFPMLLARGGGSATLLAGRIPYAAEDFREVLGSTPERLVDARAARSLAMVAFRHAIRVGGDLGPDRVIGLGSTSKLAKGPGERAGRPHEIHLALQSSGMTTSWSAFLPDGQDRAWEERINAILLLNLVAEARDLDDRLPLEHEGRSLPDRSIERRSANAEGCGGSMLEELLVGRRQWVGVGLGREQSWEGRDSPKLILPGSFRPLHEGHLAMAEVASRLTGLPCAFEVSILHPEKPPLDYIAIRSRMNGFRGISGRLYWTDAPTYIEKARLFPGSTFVVGHDTALRIVDPRFYGGSTDRDAMLAELERLGTRFLVFGRVDSTGSFRDFSPEEFDHPVSGFFARTTTPVPVQVFRHDISSTEIRSHSAVEID